MKIGDNRPDKPVSDDGGEVRRQDETQESRFDELLEKKEGAGRERRRQAAEEGRPAASAAAGPGRQGRGIQVAKAAGAAAAPPNPVEGLVEEILVGVNRKGQSEVQLQFDSSTLKGLRVHLSQDSVGIAIEFFSRSGDVAQLLARHSYQLNQALADKGVEVSRVQIHQDSGPALRPEERRERGSDSEPEDGGQEPEADQGAG